MKKIVMLLCLLLFGWSTSLAQLVKEREIKRYLRQDIKKVTRAIEKRLPPISTASTYDVETFDGEVRKYYPVDVYNGDNTLRDTLFYNEETILIYQSPLLDFPGIKDSLIRKSERRTLISNHALDDPQCKRGFTAQWFIRNDSLFVGRISQYGLVSETPDYRLTLLSFNTLKSRLERITGIPYDNRGLMFAGWATGKIVGGANGVYLYRNEKDKSNNEIKKYYYRGYYIYPKEYWIEVENGIVKDVKIKTL
ncbi:MAG TPA: hypothetical protein IAB03_09225 [Candidatus Gallibacteroides avistercoris]|uniref:Uncharacterized protein n=1 Tax=Candidatus Gallibacteroides avistercoris TaxID=2840833 RepID=A0A9D1SD26_9BACT|nr:hypothetical protein [Candidatus Gallibacteroides avistercoris]